MFDRRRLISIVVPVLNEEKNIQFAYSAVSEVFAALDEKYSFEIIFTDNHSTDQTSMLVSQLALQDARVKYLRFSRNVGYQKSILTGMLHARGDAAIQLDCDLQDPPSLIPEFLRLWESGYRVVYGIRVAREEAKYIEWSRKFFYFLIDRLSETALPQNAGDFRLVDRAVLNVLKQLDDHTPYLRGFFAEIGFEQIGVPYQRSARVRGSSKFSLKEMVRLGLDGVLNHSVVPLRLATWVGLTTTLLTALGMVVFLVGRLLNGDTWPAGFATLVLLLLLSISLNSLFLGIIGEYLARVFKQTKRFPTAIVEKAINVEIHRQFSFASENRGSAGEEALSC